MSKNTTATPTTTGATMGNHTAATNLPDINVGDRVIYRGTIPYYEGEEFVVLQAFLPTDSWDSPAREHYTLGVPADGTPVMQSVRRKSITPAR